MARARLVNSGDVIREDTMAESTEAEGDMVSEKRSQSAGVVLNGEKVQLGDLEIGMSSVLVILIIIDILISAGVIFDD